MNFILLLTLISVKLFCMQTIKELIIKLFNRKRRFTDKFKLEHWFLCIFIPFGLFFAIITPLGQNPDEPVHIFRIWQISQGDIIARKIENNKHDRPRYGGDVPKSIDAILHNTHFSNYLNPTFKWRNINYSDESLSPLNASGTTLKGFTGAAIYSPAAYIPGVVAVWIGLIFSLPSVVVLYLIRVFSLLFIAGCLYAAIKITPKWKWIFFTCGLLPSVVAAGGAISADSVVFGSSFLFIAYILRLSFQNKPVSSVQFILLFGLLSLVSLSKTPYSLLAILILLVPVFNKKSRQTIPLIKLGSVIALTAIISLIWMKLTSYMAWPHGLRAAIDPIANKQIITSETIGFMKVIYNSIFYNGVISLTGIIGHFGWLAAPMSNLMIIPAIIALILSPFVGKPSNEKLPKLKRGYLWFSVTLSVTTILVFLAIAASLYIYWSDPRSAVVAGIQGRYLVPLLPLILLLLGLLGQLQKQRQLKITIACLLVVSLVFALLTAYARYYIDMPVSV